MTPNPIDVIAADLFRGDKCGHAALAAVLGVPMSEARLLMPPSESKLVSVAMWTAALDRAGKKWRDIGASCPAPGCYGLVRLCFSGSRQTHLIAVHNQGGSIRAFDNNSLCWMGLGLWETMLLPVLKVASLSRKCWIGNVIEVEAR